MFNDVAVAARLMKTNKRLNSDKAGWLAGHWSAELSPGRWSILGEVAHRVVSAQLYREDETLAIFACIAAPVLMVEASDDSMAVWWKGKFTLAQHHERLKAVPRLERVTLPDCSHMLHHDQPELLADLMERFLSQS